MKLAGLIRSNHRWDLHVYANGNTTFVCHPCCGLFASLCFPAAVEPWPALLLIDDRR